MLCKLQSNDHKQKLGLKIERCLLAVSYLIWPTHSNSIIQYAILLTLIFINKRSQKLTSASYDQRKSSLRDWMKTMKKKLRSMWNWCNQNYQIVISGMAMTMSQTCLLVWDCHDLWKLPAADMTWELRRQWLTARMKTRTLQFVR